MCTGRCAHCIGRILCPLALISIICNIILFFPGWSVKYVQNAQITEEVKYMGGLVGGGIMVLIPVIHLLRQKRGCCADRCGMFLSVLLAAVGVAGALYSFIVALMGLIHGPYCKTILLWSSPFKDKNYSYLKHRDSWTTCTEPSNVVEFNVRLFSTLMVAGALELVLCSIQMINGLFGCICGTCKG